MEEYLFFGVALAISALAGFAIGKFRGRPIVGFLLGLFLGPIGWLVIILAPNHKKPEERAQENQ